MRNREIADSVRLIKENVSEYDAEWHLEYDAHTNKSIIARKQLFDTYVANIKK